MQEEDLEEREHKNDSVTSVSAELHVMTELSLIRDKMKVLSVCVCDVSVCVCVLVVMQVQMERLLEKEEELELREEEVVRKERELEEVMAAIKEREHKVRETERVMMDLQAMMCQWLEKQSHHKETPEKVSVILILIKMLLTIQAGYKGRRHRVAGNRAQVTGLSRQCS